MVEINIRGTALAIDDGIEAAADKGWNGQGINIGALAHPCWRKLWYDIRHVFLPEEFNAKTLRIFETGNAWEERILKYLIQAEGIEVECGLTNANGKQEFVVGAGGWLRGKLDAEVIGVPEAPKTVHVCEIKSANQKSFTQIQKLGIKKAKPEYYCQATMYAHLRGRRFILFIVANKNTEELYVERWPIDIEYAIQQEIKAEKIVGLTTPPPKLHEAVKTAASKMTCGWCKYKGLCHERAFPTSIGCRSCVHVRFGTQDNYPSFHCDLTYHPIHRDDVDGGCDRHLYLTDLIPGEVVEFNDEDQTVLYKLHDGREWVDG